MRADIDDLGSALRIDELKLTVEELDKQTLDPDFWSNSENSSSVLQKLKQTKDTIENYEALKSRLEDAITLAEMAIEENDESCVEEVESELTFIERETDKMRLETLLSGKYDHCNAILSFHPFIALLDYLFRWAFPSHFMEVPATITLPPIPVLYFFIAYITL